VAKKIEPAHFRNPNFQNRPKVAFSILLLIKTTPFLIKTTPKPYYFLTLFVRIFYFLRFRASAFPQKSAHFRNFFVAFSRQFSVLTAILFSAFWKLVAGSWQLSQPAHLRNPLLSPLSFLLSPFYFLLSTFYFLLSTLYCSPALTRLLYCSPVPIRLSRRSPDLKDPDLSGYIGIRG